ncbi:ABC transporter permease [Vibrio sonorensis]|uniref:ABC transporter permease n=1 Tax=Vibrio sonorensis TaxID=1004316 RepID=UPI0008DA5612|nr:iron ABC transporter permease [Vibrio sonorensis]
MLQHSQHCSAKTRHIDPVFYWLTCLLISFFQLPAFALDYGFFGATKDEFHNALGWTSVNISWLWFALPLGLLIRPLKPKGQQARSRHIFDITYSVGCLVIVVMTSWYTENSLGYGVIVLFLALSAVITLGLSRLKFLGGDVFIIGSLLTTALLITTFVVYPSIAILMPAFVGTNGDNASGSVWDTLGNVQILRVIYNSMLLGTSVSLGSTLFGLLLAFYSTRVAKHSAFFARAFSILPIVTPPFIVGLGVSLMLGRSSYITEFMVEHLGLVQTNWLYGLPGIWIAQVLAFSPISFMILDGAIRSLDPSQEEVSKTLRSSRYQTLFYLVLPLLKPAIANSFLIVFVHSLADFTNPLVLGGGFDVLSTQIYFYMVGSQLDTKAASTLGSILLIFTLTVFMVQYFWIGKRSYVTISTQTTRGKVRTLPASIRLFVTVFLFVWVVFNLLLYGNILYGSFTVNWGVDYRLTLDNYQYLFGPNFNQGAWPSLISSISYASIAAPLTTLVGILIAYLVVRQQFYGKKVIEFASLICFAIPGTMTGVSFILAFNGAPFYLVGTTAIIVISMIVRSVPIGIRAGIASLSQVDKGLDEASMCLRANSFNTLSKISLPLLRPVIFSTLVYSFVRSMTTVSSVIFFVTPDSKVATSYILNRVEDGEYGIAIAYGSILILIMLTIIFLVDFFVGKTRIRHTQPSHQ